MDSEQDANPHILAIIPARGGSKGLPGKNTKSLAGKPLIAWTIEAALKCRYINRTVVTTDDQTIADISKRFGAEVPFLRPANLGDDATPTAPVLKHCLEEMEKIAKVPFDIVVFLQVTDIFRKIWMLDGVVEKLIQEPDLDTVFVAHPTHKNYWRVVDGRAERVTDFTAKVRQTREPIFREDAGLASASRAHVIRSSNIIGDKVGILPNPDPMSFIDIHTDLDLKHAEATMNMPEVTVND